MPVCVNFDSVVVVAAALQIFAICNSIRAVRRATEGQIRARRINQFQLTALARIIAQHIFNALAHTHTDAIVLVFELRLAYKGAAIQRIEPAAPEHFIPR